MSGTVASLWRHPIKAHGFEALRSMDLSAGQTVPWDRSWAVAQAAGKLDGGAWVPCGNFSRGAFVPALMAIRARYDESTGQLTLTHPERPELVFDPDSDSEAFIDWVRPISLSDQRAPVALVRATERGMTDTDFASISILNRASLRTLGQKLGQPIHEERFRGNIWLDSLGPWEEFEWIGKQLEIGGAVIEVRERITRCKATMASPETGKRDADTLGALDANWGHTNFGVYGVVLSGGTITLGDAVKVT